MSSSKEAGAVTGGGEIAEGTPAAPMTTGHPGASSQTLLGERHHSAKLEAESGLATGWTLEREHLGAADAMCRDPVAKGVWPVEPEGLG